MVNPKPATVLLTVSTLLYVIGFITSPFTFSGLEAAGFMLAIAAVVLIFVDIFKKVEEE